MSDSTDEVEEIKSVCEKYGYGQVMTVASGLWNKYMLDQGSPTSGVFVPVLPSDIKKQRKKHYKK